jgi:hypothetical protein
MKSSCHSLIPFFLLFCSCQFRRFDSIPLFPSSSRQAGVSKLDPSLPFILLNTFYNHFARITQKEFLLIRFLVIDVLLLRSFTSAGMCLPSPCLAVRIHVTVRNLYLRIYVQGLFAYLQSSHNVVRPSIENVQVSKKLISLN